MKSITSSILTAAVLLGLSHLSMADGVTPIACYKTSDGVTFNSKGDFNSLGYCSGLCKNSATFALSNRFSCYCGDGMPADSDKVDDDKCNLSCPGFPTDNCGGASFFYFYDMGTTTSIPKAGEDSSDPSPPTTSGPAVPTPTQSSKPSVVTVGGQTVVVTASGQQPATATPSVSSSGGTNKAGIAAGVVVGVVAVAAIIGGAFLFLRNRKRRAIEEEHRRNAAVSSFIGGKPPTSSGGGSSFTDTRLDPAVMAQRRMSDGSIADNQDYSRRILKVTNA